MKLLRYGPPGEEKPGILDGGGAIRDLSGHVGDITGETIGAESLARLRQIDPASLPKVAGRPRIGPCVGNVGKFVAIGLNYSDHAKEAGMAIPDEPLIFTKATSSISGPD
ncbi:MAG: ureidoglycolate lyase, partial [Alphaproteobacteria bacterium]|nr:ureidoglycolate lyase [Alphaproteobacteria bacterium]